MLQPGRGFTLVVPLVGYDDVTVSGWYAWADPTHLSQWWFPQSLTYFCEDSFIDEDYVITRWQPLGDYFATGMVSVLPQGGSWWTVRSGWEGAARLVKPG